MYIMVVDVNFVKGYRGGGVSKKGDVGKMGEWTLVHIATQADSKSKQG